MPKPSPWDEISTPAIDFNVLQVASEKSVPCFWGRNEVGCCLFIVKLEGDHFAQFKKNVIKINGLEIDLRAGENGQQLLILTLERHVDRDLFEGLCLTLASALEYASDSASALAVAMAHIRRWKTFLSGKNQQLPPEAVRGLFAEIVFLIELLDRKMSDKDVVEAWHGPERSHQDFIFGDTAVEVKSLSGTERNSVRISSEDQLESLNNGLYLRIFRLSNLENAAGARSLNDIVVLAQSRLGAADAIEAFDQKLVAHGYAPLPSYDEPRFIVSDTRSYHIRGGFPRLIRSQLPSGIVKVNYDIQLEAIAEYECDSDAIFGDGQ